jgi:uncharacterized protein
MELCLGTVQLGMSYGIAGGSDFTKKQALHLLDAAFDLGIRVFDTASAYGEAEDILGHFIASHNTRDTKIISKCHHTDSLEEYLIKTLETLNTKQIDGYLFHDSSLIYNEHLIKEMNSFKKAGLVNNIGVSLYNPEDALYAAKQAWIDYIQIPYNVLDQRLDNIDFFNIAKSNNKIIFARSVLLQGLMAMNLIDVKNKLEFAYDDIYKYLRIINKYDFSQLEAAIQYVKANDKIDYIVFGVYGEEQLKEFIDIFNNVSTNYNMNQELKKEFYFINEKVISPNLWSEV